MAGDEEQGGIRCRAALGQEQSGDGVAQHIAPEPALRLDGRAAVDQGLGQAVDLEPAQILQQAGDGLGVRGRQTQVP